MLSSDFQGFLGIFGTLAHKVAQTLFVSHETWHTTLFGIYYCVKVVIIKNDSHMLKITCYVSILRVFKRFWYFAHKVAQTWFVFHETWHTTLFDIYIIALKWLEL